MKKIPTIYLRDFAGNPSLVTHEANPECAWVFAGEGIATRKFDGTCCMFDGTTWWKRREVKPGKPIPSGFKTVSSDLQTGKIVGWLPVEASDKWHAEAIANAHGVAAGTYELCGPKVQGNPEGFPDHTMVPHGDVVLDNCPRGFDSLKKYLESLPFEGVVFHHPDGRMAKIKRRDFGYK